MTLVDLNLLLYAVDEAAPDHDRAQAWWDALLSSGETVALAWSVLLGFVRLTTRATIFRHPLTVEEALDYVAGWLALPNVTAPEPGPRHTAVLAELLHPLGSGGNLVPDAHLAALAIERGATLCSRDGDFARFAGLRWRDPLR